MRDGDEQERVAVPRCVGSGLDPNDAAGAAAIVDNDLPAELLTELSGNGAADQVVSSACWKWNDESHRPRRIGLRPSEARHGWQRGSGRDQMEQLSAGKVHGKSSRNADDYTAD